MKINSAKFDRAKQVLNVVKKALKDFSPSAAKDVEIDVGSYCNCREQGLGLLVSKRGGEKAKLSWRVYLFAEARSSDAMVVFFGSRDNMDGLGWFEIREADQREYFSHPNSEAKAAKWIAADIRKWIKSA